MDAAELAADALAEVDCAFDADRLATFLRAAERVARLADRLQPPELTQCRQDGAWAAGAGVKLPELVDVYLSSARLLWLQLASDPRGDSDLVAMGAAVLQTVDDALAQVATGYADAGRVMLRNDEANRRDFIDDLLLGSGETSSLFTRAEHYGLAAGGWHCVIVLGGERPLHGSSTAASDLEAAARRSLPGRGVLVAPRHGRLVVVLELGAIAERARSDEADQIASALLTAADHVSGDRDDSIVSVSRRRQGVGAVAASFHEADEGFALIAALDWPGRLVHADELAVFRVLLRDRESMVELVESVLGPLRLARGGVGPLLETLHVFLSAGAVATETARRLHLSVRAVTYRLKRIADVTGYDPTDADQRLTLHVAVAGAHLLRWEETAAAGS